MHSVVKSQYICVSVYQDGRLSSSLLPCTDVSYLSMNSIGA